MKRTFAFSEFGVGVVVCGIILLLGLFLMGCGDSGDTNVDTRIECRSATGANIAINQNCSASASETDDHSTSVPEPTPTPGR